MSVKLISAAMYQSIYESRKVELLDSVRKHNGNLKLVADDCCIPLHQLQFYYKNQEEFKEAVDDAKDALYESAEVKLVELIDKSNFNALNLFFSKSPQAKARGWGEKTEVSQNTNMTLTAQQKEEEVKRMLGLTDNDKEPTQGIPGTDPEQA